MISPPKHRGQRALVASSDAATRSDLSVLLSSYGYTVDHAQDRRQGLEKFLTYKHAAVFMDAAFLPRHPSRLKQLYSYAHRTPLSFVLAPAEKREQSYPFLKDAAWGMLPLPLDPAQFTHTFERAGEYARLKANRGFFRDLMVILGLTAPIAALLVLSVAVK